MPVDTVICMLLSPVMKAASMRVAFSEPMLDNLMSSPLLSVLVGVYLRPADIRLTQFPSVF